MKHILMMQSWQARSWALSRPDAPTETRELCLWPDFRITREHGQWFERNGVRYLAMYHPSALLRDPARRPETYTDLLTLREAVRTLGPLPNA